MDKESQLRAVEDGTYYRDARRWYSELYHTPIAERSYYLFVIALSLINMYFAIASFESVFPIKPMVALPTYSDDLWNELPRIKPISMDRGEDKNLAVMRFFLENYVETRESYELRLYELRYRNIWSESSKEVFDRYKTEMDAANPHSPYRQYTNRAKRSIDIISLTFERGKKESVAHVEFYATVTSVADSEEINHSRWQADITYKYTDFFVDQSLDTQNWVAHVLGLTGNSLRASGERRKVVPMTFIVSDYKVKELLE